MDYRGFVGPSYRSQSLLADPERTVNLVLENVESGSGTVRRVLYPSPGVELLVATNSTQGRAHSFFPTAIGVGREFEVIGTTLIETDSDAVPTARGTVAMNTNPASIASNGDGGGELLVTSGGNGYLYTLATNVLTQITALNGKATMGDQLDGYLLALDANTGTMYGSELLDGATWTTGTMFAQRNKAPDPWIAMKVRGGYIYLLGEQTSEVWYDAGSSPFPFAPHPSGLMQYGIAAPWSAAICGESLLWLGSSEAGKGQVLMTSGFSAQVVSDYALSSAINSYSVTSDAYGDGYELDGHTRYVLSFPTADKTWMYDLESKAWTELGTWTQDAFDYSVWRPRCHAFAFGQHRWLHSTGAGIYRMKGGQDTVYTDVDGLPLRRMRTGPIVEDENNRLFCSEMELHLEPGLGLGGGTGTASETSGGQGFDPQVMLRISWDGGKTWSKERWCSAGKQGQYGTRVNWHRLGSGRQFVAQIVMTDPVPWRILGASLELHQEAGAQRGAA